MCISPVIIKNPIWGTAKQNNKTPYYIAVPCGKCPECLNARRAAWSYRLNKEAQYYPDYQLSFVSLDYSPDYLPIKFETQKPTLEPVHLTKFFKDIRNSLRYKDEYGNIKYQYQFKFYAIGEYGETHQRPHYHCLIFGLPNYFDFAKFWKYGRCDVGFVEPASVHYVSGYFLLLNNVPEGSVKPFSRMSKNLGLQHFKDYEDDYYRYVLENQMLHVGNFTTPVPRYYKNHVKESHYVPDTLNLPLGSVRFTGDLFEIQENYKRKKQKPPKLQTLKD